MLKKGDKAPNFSLTDENGNTVKLSDFTGKDLVLFFYPKDDTPGCTTEACDFRDFTAEFESLGVKILGISKDDQKSHDKFHKKFNLSFPILSDTTTEMQQTYGVWQEKNKFGRTYMGTVRTTFLIDKSGVIVEIWPNVNVPGHVEHVLNTVKSHLA